MLRPESNRQGRRLVTSRVLPFIAFLLPLTMVPGMGHCGGGDGPKVAKCKGSGSIDEAQSFTCAAP